MKDDPEMTHDVIHHALNEWMHETWTFNYSDRIFATPVITLPIVERALEELEWCLERGARTVLVRPGTGARLPRQPSFGLEEFDPLLAGMHQGRHPGFDARLRQRLLRVRQRLGAGRRVLAVQADAVPQLCDGPSADPGRDGCAGVPWRAISPQPPSCGSCPSKTVPTGCRTCSRASRASTKKMPQSFSEDPVEAFKRCVYITPVLGGPLHRDREDGGHRPGDVRIGLATPPRALKDPITFVDELTRLRRGGCRQDHGRQLDAAHESVQACQEASFRLIER